MLVTADSKLAKSAGSCASSVASVAANCLIGQDDASLHRPARARGSEDISVDEINATLTARRHNGEAEIAARSKALPEYLKRCARAISAGAYTAMPARK